MTDRERFCAVMNYQPVDHPPLYLVGPWPDTLERWYGEGLPRGSDFSEYLRVAPLQTLNISGNTGLYPLFEPRVLAEEDDFRISLDSYGRTVREFRDHTSMPEWLEFPVKGSEDLRRLLDEHFDLTDLEARYPADWEEKLGAAHEQDAVVIIDGGCYYWTLRSLAGVAGASYLCYDAPDLVEELCERINVVCLEGLRRAAPRVTIDAIGFGEDLAYKNGPLISPAMFRRFILPRYRKVMDLAHAHGITLGWCDSDGDLRQLLPDYLSVGITITQPCEVAAGMVPHRLRAEYGRELRMVGGIDKREVARGPAAIEAEIERNRPVIEEGGFLPAIDHSVPADVSLANYLYFLEAIQGALGLG